jgi:hypothetical protein
VIKNPNKTFLNKMTTIEGLQSHPSRIRGIDYTNPPDPLYDIPDEKFFSEDNIAYIQQTVNRHIGRTGYTVDYDSIIRIMRAVYQSSFLHRDFNYMTNAAIRGVVQHIEDEIDFMKMQRQRSRWILNYPMESGITRMNSTSIKLNKRKPYAPIFAFSNV